MRPSGPDHDAVLAVFGRELPARVERINEALGKLKLAESAEARAEHLIALAHDAHNLRGAAATVGLEGIADLAGDVERDAERLLRSGSDATAELIGAASRLLVRLDDRSIVSHTEGNRSDQEGQTISPT